MAVCMNKNGTTSCSMEDSDVFASDVFESDSVQEVLPSSIEVALTHSARRLNLPPMSAPPIVNTTFQYDVQSSFDDSTSMVFEHENNHIENDNPSNVKKSRAKSLSFVEPASLLLRQCQERLVKNSNCIPTTTIRAWKWNFQSFSSDRNNESLPFSTPLPEQLAGVSGIQYSPPARQIYQTQREYSPGRMCRICHDGAEVLISPCICTGSVALIHKECLERWLTQTNSSSCELCMFNYRVERRPLPYHKVFSDSRNGKLRRSIITDLACFIGLTPLALAAISLCLLGAMQVFQNMNVYDGGLHAEKISAQANRQWEAGWLLFLAVMLLVVYLIWFSCTFNTHLKTWSQWRIASLEVKLLDEKTPSKNQIEASSGISLPPIRLMMDEDRSTINREASFNNSLPDTPMRAELHASTSPFLTPPNIQTQGGGSICGVTGFGTELLLATPGERAGINRSGEGIPFIC